MIDRFSWSEPLTEDQAEEMMSRTIFQNVWLEGDKLAFMMYARVDEEDTIVLAIKSISHREVEQLEESCVYITTKKGNNVDFPVYCSPDDAEEITASWPDEDEDD